MKKIVVKIGQVWERGGWMFTVDKIHHKEILLKPFACLASAQPDDFGKRGGYKFVGTSLSKTTVTANKGTTETLQINKKPIAVWLVCPTVLEQGRNAHAMQDSCSECSPYWELIPVCEKGHMLKETKKNSHGEPSNKAYCRQCKTHYQLPLMPDIRNLEITK
jgi:hypothetical protein